MPVRSSYRVLFCSTSASKSSYCRLITVIVRFLIFRSVSRQLFYQAFFVPQCALQHGYNFSFYCPADKRHPHFCLSRISDRSDVFPDLRDLPRQLQRKRKTGQFGRKIYFSRRKVGNTDTALHVRQADKSGCGGGKPVGGNQKARFRAFRFGAGSGDEIGVFIRAEVFYPCLLYTSPSPRD